MLVIITGAAQGIGKAIVKQCIENNDFIYACDIDTEGLNNLTTEFPLFKGQLHTIDVANYQAVKTLFENMSTDGHKEMALINNAGVYLGKNILDYKPQEIDYVIDINIKGATYFSKFFAKKVTEMNIKGKIINITSVSGQEGSSDAIYGLSKAALIGLTKSCAMNFSPHILVNAIAPTMVDTAMMDTIPSWRKKAYNEHNLIKEPVTPEAVADTVSFLLTNKANHYTGAVFDINNGGYLR